MTGNRKHRDMTSAQKAVLMLAAKADDGLASDGSYQIKGTWHKADCRTIVALVSRGLLAGGDGRITCTPDGLRRAKEL